MLKKTKNIFIKKKLCFSILIRLKKEVCLTKKGLLYITEGPILILFIFFKEGIV